MGAIGQFRAAVSGSRHLRDEAFVRGRLAHLLGPRLPFVSLLHGGCRGVDLIAAAWGAEVGVMVEEFAADWKAHGRRAGPYRNTDMVSTAHGLIAFLAKDSRGTADAIAKADRLGMPIVLYEVELSVEGLVVTHRVRMRNRE